MAVAIVWQGVVGDEVIAGHELKAGEVRRAAEGAAICIRHASVQNGHRDALPPGSASVRDLWAKQDLGIFPTQYTATAVPSHGVAMLKVVGQ